MNVLVDTNVLLDFVLEREPFVDYAEQVFEATQEDLPFANCRRGIALFSKLVRRNGFELPARPNHIDLSVVVNEED